MRIDAVPGVLQRVTAPCLGGGVWGGWHARHAADVRDALRGFLSHVDSALRSCEGRALYVYRDFPPRLPSCTILTMGACARGEAEVRVAAAVAVRMAALFPRCMHTGDVEGLRSVSPPIPPSRLVRKTVGPLHRLAGSGASVPVHAMPSGE